MKTEKKPRKKVKIPVENVNDLMNDNLLEDNYCQECIVDDDVILTSEIIEKKPKKVYERRMCPHRKRKDKCVECKGSGICIHNKLKSICIECGGSSICIHNKQKSNCKDCNKSAFCVHNKRKSRCVKCKGSGICIHNKRKEYCKDCDGSAFCEHNKIKSHCKDCNISAFCIHNKQKDYCVKCHGSQICIHNKQKSTCKKCDGSAICLHRKRRSTCKECNGSAFCTHGGSKVCKSSWCETTISSKKYEGYCAYCYVNLFPDKPISRNYKTKELNVVDSVKKCYPDFTWVCDKKILDGCSRKRPDMLVDLGTHIIIVEVDENAHTDYDSSCETKRMMELSKDVGHRPIVFIRFNPDQYIDRTGEVVKSCWKINKVSGILHVDIQKEGEWKDRLLELNDEIQYWIDNVTEKTIETVELFY
jgi:hypothetical protein